MKRCKCGNAVAANARVCPHCGRRLTHPFVMFLALCFAAFIIMAFYGTVAVGKKPAPAPPRTENDNYQSAEGACMLWAEKNGPLQVGEVLVRDHGL